MKDWIALTAELFLGLISFVAIALALAAGFGAFTPWMNPLWLIATIPIALAIAAAILAALLRFIEWRSYR